MLSKLHVPSTQVKRVSLHDERYVKQCVGRKDLWLRGNMTFKISVTYLVNMNSGSLVHKTDAIDHGIVMIFYRYIVKHSDRYKSPSCDGGSEEV